MKLFCNLNQISFGSLNAAFIISIARGAWSADYCKSISLKHICQFVNSFPPSDAKRKMNVTALK